MSLCSVQFKYYIHTILIFQGHLDHHRVGKEKLSEPESVDLTGKSSLLKIIMTLYTSAQETFTGSTQDKASPNQKTDTGETHEIPFLSGVTWVKDGCCDRAFVGEGDSVS